MMSYFCKRKLRAHVALLCVCCMLVMQQRSYAQAVAAPVENFVVNRAVAGIIANRIAIARGIAANDSAWLATAANDPVYTATMAGVSKTMTAANVASTVLGVGLAVAGAPVWLTIAASLGVLAVGAAFVAGNTSIDVIATSSGNMLRVTQPAANVAAPSYSTGLVQIPSMKLGAQIYRDQACTTSLTTCMWFPLLPSNQTFPYRWKPYPLDTGQWGMLWAVAFSWDQLKRYYLADLTAGDVVIDYSSNPGGQNDGGVCYADWSAGDTRACTFTRTTSWAVELHWEFSANGTPRLFGAWMSTFTANPDNPSDSTFPSTYGPTTSQPLDGVLVDSSVKPIVKPDLDGVYQAIQGTNALQQPVSAPALAQLTDAAWRNAAAQPGYQGLPYSASNPVTQADVSTWQQAHPNDMPTLADMLTPATDATTYPNGVPISTTVVYAPPASTTPGNGSNVSVVNTPNVNVVNTPNVSVINTVKVDFGTDPGVADPTLESTPTGAQILQPITSLFPELRSFQTPSHTGSCPKPVFDVFGQSIVMDSHCTIAEEHRAALAAVMLAVWTMLGLFILLSA